MPEGRECALVPFSRSKKPQVRSLLRGHAPSVASLLDHIAEIPLASLLFPLAALHNVNLSGDKPRLDSVNKYKPNIAQSRNGNGVDSDGGELIPISPIT